MKDYECTDCGYRFSLDWRRRRRPYCPDCGEHLGVLRYPYDKQGRHDSRKRKTGFKKTRWTDDEVIVLQRLRATTLTYREIGLQLNRSESAIGSKLKELMKAK